MSTKRRAGMRVVTRKSLAAEVVYRFSAQYHDYLFCGKHHASLRWDPSDVLKRLKALGESPSPNQVDAAIGNASWTSVSCVVCDKDNVGAFVEFSCDDEMVTVCRECLARALEMATQQEGKESGNDPPR